MRSRNLILALCAFTAVVGAQTISSGPAPILGFIDISASAGAVQVTGLGDDSTHLIPAGAITIGNGMFPAGAMTIGNNGMLSGIAGAGGTFGNVAIPAAPANPAGLTATAQGLLMPFWDDLYPTTALPPTQIWYLNDTVNNVAIFMWKDENHFASAAAGEGITFEIQVFQTAGACTTDTIQFLYADTVFGGTMAANDNGASATVGYAHGAIAGMGNAQFSFNTASLLGVGCITITAVNAGAFSLAASSPFGPGSLQINISGGGCGGGTYFLAATLNQGAYPAGWLYGVDIPLPELSSEITTGYPFIGSLDTFGATQIGPFGAPTGLTFYAVAMTVVGAAVVGQHTTAITYTVP